MKQDLENFFNDKIIIIFLGFVRKDFKEFQGKL